MVSWKNHTSAMFPKTYVGNEKPPALLLGGFGVGVLSGVCLVVDVLRNQCG